MPLLLFKVKKGSSLWILSRLKHRRTEPLTIGSLITTLLIAHTPLLMKTMKSEVLEGEVHLEMILMTLRLRH